MITVTFTGVILCHLPGRVCNYVLKHYEIDTPKSPEFDNLK